MGREIERAGARLVFYHRTSAEGAAAILASGFRDATGFYMVPIETTGVFIANEPLDPGSGTADGPLLRVALEATEEDLAAFEWVEEGKPYREWQVPAALLNTRGHIRELSEDEEDELLTARVFRNAATTGRAGT